MARELPEAGMAAELPIPEMGMAALYIAVGCAEVLKPLLDFLGEAGVHRRSPVLDAAAAVVVITVPVAYLAGVMLLYLHVAPAAAGAPVAPAALGQFNLLVCALLLFMAFIFFLAAGVR